MSTNADLLSNEELLGLHEDGTSTTNGTTEQPIEIKPKRRYHKLDDDLMLSNRGLPALIKSLGKYKFRGKRRPAEMSSYERYVNKRYDRSVYFENLTRLLHIYQIWGHDVYPKYRFKDFTGVLNRAASSPAIKEYKRTVIRKEVDEKLKAEAEKEDAYTEHLGEEPNALTSATRATSSEMDDSAMTDVASSGLFVGDDTVVDQGQMDLEEEPLYTLANKYGDRTEKEQQSDAEFMDQIGKDLTHVHELSAIGREKEARKKDDEQKGDEQNDDREKDDEQKDDREKDDEQKDDREKDDEQKDDREKDDREKDDREKDDKQKDEDDILGLLLSDDENDEETQMKVGNTSLIAEKDADLRAIDEAEEAAEKKDDKDEKNEKDKKDEETNKDKYDDEESYMDNIMHDMGI